MIHNVSFNSQIYVIKMPYDDIGIRLNFTMCYALSDLILSVKRHFCSEETKIPQVIFKFALFLASSGSPFCFTSARHSICCCITSVFRDSKVVIDEERRGICRKRG